MSDDPFWAPLRWTDAYRDQATSEGWFLWITHPVPKLGMVGYKIHEPNQYHELYGGSETGRILRLQSEKKQAMAEALVGRLADEGHEHAITALALIAEYTIKYH